MDAISTTKAPTTKTRRTPQQWREIIQAYQSSNLSQSDFCRSRGIPVSSFCKWKAKLSESSCESPAGEFVALPMTLPVSTQSWRIELDLGDGTVLRIR